MMDKFLTKFNDAIHSSWGILVTLLTILFTFIEPEKTSFIVVGFSIFADTFWGIAAAIKLKKFIISTVFRRVFIKIGIYSFSLLGVYSIEMIIHDEGSFIGLRSIAVIAAVTEFWSMSANALIVYPNMPFLKILRGQLKGEIKAKVGKNVNVDEILKDDKA